MPQLDTIPLDFSIASLRAWRSILDLFKTILSFSTLRPLDQISSFEFFTIQYLYDSKLLPNAISSIEAMGSYVSKMTSDILSSGEERSEVMSLCTGLIDLIALILGDIFASTDDGSGSPSLVSIVDVERLGHFLIKQPFDLSGPNFICTNNSFLSMLILSSDGAPMSESIYSALFNALMAILCCRHASSLKDLTIRCIHKLFVVKAVLSAENLVTINDGSVPIFAIRKPDSSSSSSSSSSKAGGITDPVAKLTAKLSSSINEFCTKDFHNSLKQFAKQHLK
jgi:hypothetical protein